MDSMESCVPPGFRFHPTDEELVGYYLKKKVASQRIDLDVIRDVDLYRIEPWDLQERCRIGYEEQNEWYFFSHKDKKYPTGTRTNRATMAGFWKATGRDKAVYDKSKLIGMRKTLVFYKGRAPNGQKTDWIMHEYRLESDENGPPQEEGWVVCRAFKKRTNTQSKAMDGWDSSYIYDETPSGVSTTMMDPVAYSSRNHHPQGFFSNNLLCKQELLPESDGTLTTFMNSSIDHFLQLPQLESPSLPFIKRPPSSSNISLLSQNKLTINNNVDEKQEKTNNNDNNNSNNNNMSKVTDWRALDKFVASQLSHEDKRDDHDEHRVSSSGFGRPSAHNQRQQQRQQQQNPDDFGGNSDMDAFLLLQSSGINRDGNGDDGGDDDDDDDDDHGMRKLMMDGFLSSSSHESDNIGICIFDK